MKLLPRMALHKQYYDILCIFAANNMTCIWWSGNVWEYQHIWIESATDKPWHCLGEGMVDGGRLTEGSAATVGWFCDLFASMLGSHRVSQSLATCWSEFTTENDMANLIRKTIQESTVVNGWVPHPPRMMVYEMTHLWLYEDSRWSSRKIAS